MEVLFLSSPFLLSLLCCVMVFCWKKQQEENKKKHNYILLPFAFFFFFGSFLSSFFLWGFIKFILNLLWVFRQVLFLQNLCFRIKLMKKGGNFRRLKLLVNFCSACILATLNSFFVKNFLGLLHGVTLSIKILVISVFASLCYTISLEKEKENDNSWSFLMNFSPLFQIA